jgi:hypothetical protein
MEFALLKLIARVVGLFRLDVNGVLVVMNEDGMV